ncbi:MAG: hypothetical protein IIB22_06855 [Chloroflexi bacterium]|nr:hypothetical protein [Chloroflexota bacterium]
MPTTPIILSVADGVLSWSDESENEQGFRILVEVSNQQGDTSEFQYEVDANVTGFQLPPEASGLPCPSSASFGYRLIAFNEAGDSPPSAQFGLFCPAVDFQDGPEDLPISGTGFSHDESPPLLWLAAGGLTLCALGVTLRMKRSL